MAVRNAKKKAAQSAQSAPRGKSGLRAKAAKPTKPPKSRSSTDARALKSALTEALEQQAATAEILRVISRSPNDAQPVFDTIARTAARLCAAEFCHVFRYDGELVHFVADHGLSPKVALGWRRVRGFPSRPVQGYAAGRAILSGTVVQIPDIQADAEYENRGFAKTVNYRSIVAVPMLRDGTPIGAIAVASSRRGRFPSRQIETLRTFADQAVIAIENVRLFNETKEALDQQTATAEILQAISSSPGNLQPVLETLVRAAAKFCGAPDVLIQRIDQGILKVAAAVGTFGDILAREAGSIEAVQIPAVRGSVSGRAFVDRRMIHIRDLAAESAKEYPEGRALQRRFGHRSMVATPLLREGEAIGVIAMFRMEVKPFSDKQLQLLRLFADQAVIAIENVRLFHELEVKNRDLTESLEQQTATAGILRVISSSPTDVQPVFDAIAANALNLCGATFSTCCKFDGELIQLVAFHHLKPEGITAFHAAYPQAPSRAGITARAILTGEVVHVADVLEDPEYVYRDAAKAANYRSVLAVPMLRNGVPIGSVSVFRDAPERFPDGKVELLRIFAEQAVIAIENVRLFNETKEALERQTATSEVLEAISSAQTDASPVFETIARNAHRLSGALRCNVLRYDGRLLHIAACCGFSPEDEQQLRRRYPVEPGDASVMSGRVILSGRVEQSDDVVRDPLYDQEHAATLGLRRMLGVPMVRDGVVLGVIVLAWRESGQTPPALIDLLRTFADQAVIAIENVRLFTELEARNRDLSEALEHQTATGEILRVISSSPTNVQPVFDIISERAGKLCDAEVGVVSRVEGGQLHLAAIHGVTDQGRDTIRGLHPMSVTSETATGRAVRTRDVVHIADVMADPTYERKDAATAGGWRGGLAVPMLREGEVIGAIFVGRTNPGPFPDSKIELLRTFADQAVIAIENVRLFTELEARNRDLTEALEQQTATSEILSVISKSQTDVQPVFDTIAKAARELCRATSANVFTYDGELVRVAAMANLDPQYVETMHQVYPRRPGRETAVARAIQRRSVEMIPDVLEDKDYVAALGARSIAGGFRSVLAVPLIREGNAIGGIAVGRAEPGSFPDTQVTLLKTFADQAVIAIENVRLFKELERRNRDLTEALEQQTATSEILRVISRSPRDVQPVFDAITAATLKLCGGITTVATFDGEMVRLVGLASWKPEVAEANRRAYPRPPSRETMLCRAILTGSTVNIPDVQQDPDYAIPQIARAAGYHSAMAVPLMREGKAIGAIAVARPEIGAFTDKQVSLLKTFADQAVIAIENVRLFTELDARNHDLTEALEQQTATSEILRVISQSPTDVQPVFETIADAAMKLCGGSFATVVRFDGTLVHIEALASSWKPEEADAIRCLYPMAPSRGTVASRAVLIRDVVNIPDVQDDAEYAIRDVAHSAGYRGAVGVPLMLQGSPIGAIGVGRPQPGLFPEKQITLLKTFADQAVIAIENVRLFKELEARNRELTESLEHQTATGEILRVISSSPTDVQPVFDIISERAGKLCDADISDVSRIQDEQIHLAAIHGVTRSAEEAIRGIFPMPLSAETATGRAMRSSMVVHIADVMSDPTYETKDAATTGGWRGCLAVPMVREGHVIGAIFVARRTPGLFADSKIELLKTFADQAVIAIENVRLFKELKTRTLELTRSVGELKALGEVGQAVSSTLDLGTVLRTIVSRATQLAGMDGGSIWEYDEEREEFHVHATDRLPEELVEVLRATPIRRGEGALGKLAVTSEPVSINDFADDRTYQSRLRNALLRSGFHSVFAVPLLRENHLLGALAVNRRAPGEFDSALTELLKTFATQSALAIQNARLFREIEDKSRQLETASRHKSEFLANMSHELRTPLNAIIGFSEVLYERMFGDINEKQAEYLSDILESGRHLLGLINDILDLSKIEAGRMELEASDFDLPSAIENTLILIRERAQRRGIALSREVDEKLGSVRGDERKVKQVLLNLLSNALKFTPEGGHIDVRAATRNGVAEISVTDTGVGIAPEDQAAVFEEFRQVGSASKKVEGTGLGLAISRKFIELHGGKIWVESEVGKGATFTFTLPHAPAAEIGAEP